MSHNLNLPISNLRFRVYLKVVSATPDIHNQGDYIFFDHANPLAATGSQANGVAIVTRSGNEMNQVVIETGERACYIPSDSGTESIAWDQVDMYIEVMGHVYA